LSDAINDQGKNADERPGSGRLTTSTIFAGAANPHLKTPPISPIFTADSVTLVVSREKDGIAAGFRRMGRCEGL
jgi:hypothetical protein